MSKDYYKTLGVEKNASKEDIKKAYKNLAKKYHPDLNKEEGSAEKFKEINEAAAVLGDDKKRANYDRFGTADSGLGGGPGGFDFRGFNASDMGFDFDEIFDTFFGGGGSRRRHGPRRGHDLRFDLEITLEEVFSGTKKAVSIPKVESCPHCHGTGAESSGDIISCPECRGQGHILRTQRTPFGLFQTQSLCQECEGTGKVVKKRCSTCRGEGVVEVRKKITIKVPKGVDEGTRLRISGEGEAGMKGGPAGDLYVVIHVAPHDLFRRSGDDIEIEMPVSFTQAALGDSIEVPTLTGKASLKIPAGTQSGTTFRMKEKGLPKLDGYGTGHQNVTVTVEVPSKLSRKQQDLLKEFEKESQDMENKPYKRILKKFNLF